MTGSATGIKWMEATGLLFNIPLCAGRPLNNKELSGLKPVMEVPGTGTAQLTSANVTASELPGASLAVRWLGPHASSAVGTGSIPDWETKIQTSV